MGVDCTRAQSGCQWTQPGPQGHVQAVGDEGHKDMRLDPVLELVKIGRSAKSSFRFLKAASISTNWMSNSHH